MTVIYFDNMCFSRVTNVTRPCNESKTFYCGGEGKKVQIDSNIFVVYARELCALISAYHPVSQNNVAPVWLLR